MTTHRWVMHFRVQAGGNMPIPRSMRRNAERLNGCFSLNFQSVFGVTP